MRGELKKVCDGLERITDAHLDEIERWMFGQAEVEIPITHKFAGGFYVRQGTLPAGALVMGHAHQEVHQCVIKTGRMTLITPDGAAAEITGPCAFTGQPGRKLVFIHEDVLMQNIHPTRDWPASRLGNIEATEEHLYRRSENWKKHRSHFQPRNQRPICDVDGCAPRLNLKPVLQCSMGVAIGIGAAGLGLGIYGAVSSAKNQSKAQNAQKKAAKQDVAQQLASLNGQIATDQANIAAAAQSQKTWQYIAIGGVVLVVVGGAVYVLKRRAK